MQELLDIRDNWVNGNINLSSLKDIEWQWLEILNKLQNATFLL